MPLLRQLFFRRKLIPSYLPLCLFLPSLFRSPLSSLFLSLSHSFSHVFCTLLETLPSVAFSFVSITLATATLLREDLPEGKCVVSDASFYGFVTLVFTKLDERGRGVFSRDPLTFMALPRMLRNVLRKLSHNNSRNSTILFLIIITQK